MLVRVREDSRFLRDGDDLVTAVDVAAPLAALGTTVKVPTVDGDDRARDPRRHPAARDAFDPRRRDAGAARPPHRRPARGRQRGRPAPPQPPAARAARAAGRVDDRAQPPHRRGRVRQAQARLRRARDPARDPGPPRAGGAGARRAARAGAGRASKRSRSAMASSSTRSTARPGSCRRCPTSRPRPAARWSRWSPTEIADDWSQRWREFHRPLVLGGRLTVRPPWEPAGD